MSSRAAITVGRPRDEVERLWAAGEHDGVSARFLDAPGDRGTEIHVEVEGGRLTAAKRLAKAKDDLRRFKQQTETGEIPRSEGTPTGETAESKLKQRPAQPVETAA